MPTQLTTAEAAAVGGFFGAIFLMIILFFFLLYILMIIANWKIFEKAGEPGWKALIPFYNVYIMYKIVNMKSWFWYLIAVNVIMSIVFVIEGYNPSATGAEMQVLTFEKYPMSLIATIFSGIVSIIAAVIYAYRTAKVFGKSNAFAVGLFFLPWIFWFILAFGNAKYSKKNLKK